MSAIIHKFNGPSKGTNKQHKLLIKQIVSCLNEELASLIGRMFDGADDMLFQLAENADSNEDQNQYFDTMRMLRVERKNISQAFAANIKNHLQADKHENTELSFDEDELSLVDQDEMDEMVAVTAMHTKAMNLYGEAVNHLEARIEFLSMKSAIIFDKEALAPKNICESFKDSLSEIELSTNNKLVLYKLFDQEVILNLEPLYKKLNQIFIDQGILPKIKLGETQATPKQTINTSSTTTATEDIDAVYTENPTCDAMTSGSYRHMAASQQNSFAGTSAGGSPHTANGGMHQEIHRVVSQFISGELTASGPGIPESFTTSNSQNASAGTQYYDRKDVMQALSNLQHSATQVDNLSPQVNSEEFKRALLADMSSRTGGAVTKQVNQIDEKTIDFIEMLFDAIVEDGSISEPVTNLLLRLQIPVIKVAMLDKDFFVDGDHPCRVTLNLIAHLGRGIINRDDALFFKLEHVVESLLDDFDVDISSFEEALNQLETIEYEELEQVAEKERKTQKEILQAHARDIVLAELQYHVSNKTLPKQAQKLLLKHWSTLMFHRYIKFGKSSDSWAEATSISKQLINLLQPINSSQAHHAVTNEKDQLLDNIHQTLLTTKQNPIEIETEINSVFLLFESMLETSEFSQNSDTYYISVDEDSVDELDFDSMGEPDIDLIETEEVDPLEEQSRIAREKIAQLPTNVRPGVWFEVYNGEDKAVRRAKLSVIIMEEAQLVFVDRMGVKVLQKDAEEFTKELSEQLSQPIADHSAFDHALGMIINSLSSTN